MGEAESKSFVMTGWVDIPVTIGWILNWQCAAGYA